MCARATNVWNGRPIDTTVPLDTLIEMLRKPPNCWLAFAMLGRRDDEASLALLVEQTRSTDEYRRRSAVEAIGSHARGGEALDEVRRLLRDPSPFVVRAAISAAQQLADSGSHDGIVALLHGPDIVTRVSALHALGVLWEPGDFEAIFDVAQHDPAKQVRRKASWTLRRHVDPGTWRRLAEHWMGSQLPRERVWACELVHRFGSPADLSLAERCRKDQDGHVRMAARNAVAALTERNR